MNNQKPKDCLCGFPVQSTTSHQHYCPAHKRISDKRNEKADEQWEEYLRGCKDAYGRYMAGVGPKPEED